MERRRALQILGALAGLPALPALGRLSDSDLFALGAGINERLEGGHAARALNAAQYRAVQVAAEHIIPRTDTPGATDARVADFVDVMLADWYPSAERARFLEGLAALDAAAVRGGDRSFADAPRPRQLAMLTALDAEVSGLRRTDGPAADAHWFATLKWLTVWGFYTSRAGIVQELRVDLMPGRYDGDAPLDAARD